jgi:hemerythrin
MPIAWNPDLATGSSQIDDQHLRLFQLFNDLEEAMARRQGEAEVGRTLNALSVYVVAHFRMEEELMGQWAYPGLEAHRKDHRTMRVQVEAMVDQYHAVGLDPTLVLRAMQRWLIGHVQNEDKAMAQFLVAAQARAISSN